MKTESIQRSHQCEVGGWKEWGGGGGEGKEEGLAGRFTEAMPYDFAQFAYLLCFPPSLFLAEYSFHTAVFMLVAMVGIGENAALLCHNLRY